jgi:hypothetical protein
MKDKISPIEEFAEGDIIHLRTILLGIINNFEAKDKDKIEASKLLGRLHHRLQIDKQVIKTPVSPEEKKIEVPAEIKAEIDLLLKHDKKHGKKHDTTDNDPE